ncbi:DMT family transporter [Streptomyces aidingensis]|uniref:Permease of the drug/metabolite transporter (DMT) superfamily n=1 Tax=Streptomyces aidingensis TaxID=910347 RepID=A0A1I1V474_9ACTN|nr:DMT family transporter [Streptomyces aidingensis]SFD77837.1 Permease of the drug/metabolite transporter (DMT) superfamily [Streptomyces aidingensis]
MTCRDAALLITLGALWGAVFPLASFVLQELPVLVVVVARTALAAAMLLPLAIRTAALRTHLGRYRGRLFTATLIQLTVPIILLTIGQQYVSAGLAGILLGTQPMWALAFTATVERRLPSSAVAGIGIGAAGTVLLFLQDLGTSHSPHALLGGVLLVLSAAGYAGGALYIQRALPGVPPVAVAATAMTLTTLLLAPWLIANPVPMPGTAAVVWLVVLGTVATGGTLVLFYALIRRIGTVRANVAAYLAPCFALLYDMPLGTNPTMTALGGLCLILFGSVMATGFPTGRDRPFRSNQAETTGTVD